MKRKTILMATLGAGLIVGCWFLGRSATAEVSPTPPKPSPAETALAHRQDVWISALEWCESRGVLTAVNPKDRDGTPSFYSWQWKPSTFKAYAIKYKLLPANLTDAQYEQKMKNYNLQREIVKDMMSDKDVVWTNEFPDCIKHKIGMPPLG